MSSTLPLRLITNLSAYVVTLPACVFTVWFAPGAIVIAPAAVSVTVGFAGCTSLLQTSLVEMLQMYVHYR